jgi:hypothetical protein
MDVSDGASGRRYSPGEQHDHDHVHENRAAGMAAALCNLGVADWQGREAIRQNLRDFIDKGFTAHHDVVEYLDSPLLKVFHGKVMMKFDAPGLAAVRPTMTHFFYMDEKDPSKVSRWVGSVGPTGF